MNYMKPINNDSPEYGIICMQCNYICKFIYNITLYKHCCECNFVYNANCYHCCKCILQYYVKTHCCNCHSYWCICKK